jgi:hypothetical protein
MASDGALRLLALTLPAYLNDFQGVYLVEEPENGIHPRAVETLFQSLSSVYDAQMLLATHSPVILGILSGILLNLVGARDFFQSFSVTRGLLTTFEHLGSLTIPLILIIVGYGVRVEGSGFRDALPVVLLRLGLLIPLAFLINAVVTRGVLGLGEASEAALFTLLVLPPPFIIPLYFPDDLAEAEREYVNNTLTLHTLATVAVIIGYLALAS